MNCPELMALANEFQQQGDIQSAVKMWERCNQIDVMFGPAHLNLYQLLKQQGNVRGAHQKLVQFLNCPVTGFTLDTIPQLKIQLQELEKQIKG